MSDAGAWLFDKGAALESRLLGPGRRARHCRPMLRFADPTVRGKYRYQATVGKQCRNRTMAYQCGS